MLSTMSSQNVAQGKRPDSLRLDSCRFGMSLTEFNERIHNTACNERSYVIIQWHHNTYIYAHSCNTNKTKSIIKKDTASE